MNDPTGHRKICQLLVAASCCLNVPDRVGRTAIMMATQHGNTQIVQDLAQAGADLDWVDLHKKTPLMAAAEQGNVAIVQILIDGGMYTFFISKLEILH